MLKSIPVYLSVILFVAILILGALYKQKIEAYAVLEVQRDTIHQALSNLHTQYKDEQSKIKNVELERDRLRSDFRSVKSELDKLKGRQPTVIARPTLVERKIQRSFDTFLDELQCETGASEKCKK